MPPPLPTDFHGLAALQPALPWPRATAAIEPREGNLASAVSYAGFATNHFGDHLAVRNCSPLRNLRPRPVHNARELLSRTRDVRFAQNPCRARGSGKMSFPHTETTGPSGGTRPVRVSDWSGVVGCGRIAAEHFSCATSWMNIRCVQEFSQRVAERPVLVTSIENRSIGRCSKIASLMTDLAVPKLACAFGLAASRSAPLWAASRCGFGAAGGLERRVLDAPRAGLATPRKRCYLPRSFRILFGATTWRAGPPSLFGRWCATIKWICAARRSFLQDQPTSF